MVCALYYWTKACPRSIDTNFNNSYKTTFLLVKGKALFIFDQMPWILWWEAVLCAQFLHHLLIWVCKSTGYSYFLNDLNDILSFRNRYKYQNLLIKYKKNFVQVSCYPLYSLPKCLFNAYYGPIHLNICLKTGFAVLLLAWNHTLFILIWLVVICKYDLIYSQKCINHDLKLLAVSGDLQFNTMSNLMIFR